jgi:hypothetical protein
MGDILRDSPLCGAQSIMAITRRPCLLAAMRAGEAADSWLRKEECGIHTLLDAEVAARDLVSKIIVAAVSGS